ncbi:MAG: hypothetical protein B6D44_11210 [Ignavibacteriales bacterium UTCHB2]|nr:MAG: hypothetical protein B6D44_11210 [Ignavibacteriales bacterium UTCHB2]HQI40691.1 hypothetical protein [Ignavibacteriaceae bacterium]
MKSINIKHLFILTLTTMLTLGMTSCKKDDFENASTLKKLYKTYKNGSIDECKYNGQTVYCAELNAYDAGSIVYDKDGKQIGTCNYAWGQVDAICEQLTDCETVYRVKDNIWGQSEVDKYGLGK